MTMFRTLQLSHLWTDFKLNYIFGKVLSSSFRICKVCEYCIMYGWEIWKLDPIFNQKRIKTSHKKKSFYRMCRYHVLFRNHSWFQISTSLLVLPIWTMLQLSSPLTWNLWETFTTWCVCYVSILNLQQARDETNWFVISRKTINSSDDEHIQIVISACIYCLLFWA